MILDKKKIEELLEVVRKRYPNWAGFADPSFNKDEVNYKQSTVTKAHELLSKDQLQDLLDKGKFDEIVRRLEKIGSDNNLLWRSVPMSGDLGILYQPNFDTQGFCKIVFDLLYGPGKAHERLNRYADYVKTNNLPNKWTFPTYFLFMCHPETEIFIKPRAIKWFVQFVGGPKTFSSVPTPPTYVTVKQIAGQLKEGLNEYGPRDMVDIQSFIYVCADVARGSTERLLSKEKKDEFSELFHEFSESYLLTSGEEHHAAYTDGRERGRKNYAVITANEKVGTDVTKDVLLKLLPYVNSPSNQEKGVWIHIAPAINGDIRLWFQNIGWTKPEDWPQIAEAILRLINRCNDNPNDLQTAINGFTQLPYAKGFQSGILTPILNALRPDDFILINNKSRRVINYFANTSYKQGLVEYPAINETAKELIHELSEEFTKHDSLGIRHADLFDMFSHWLVAIKKFDFNGVCYWKIAPGQDAWKWEACREGGFIAIGWDELDDLSNVTRTEFNERRDNLLAKHKGEPGWTKAGLEQVWKFRNIKEGDCIVANKGTNMVLGIGTVVGKYEFVPNTSHGHYLPVEWEDLTKRRIDEQGWKRTIVKLNKEKFDSISKAQLIQDEPEVNPRCPFSIKTFELLKELHKNSTREFYKQHQNELEEHVEEPFQALFREVATKLPPAISDFMETERGLFSRIPKNDFGRGGAWDFYWGAFYPKDGKRIEDAQLFMWINRDRLEFGFYIGEYAGEKRKRFLRNCQENLDSLITILKGNMDEVFVYGEREDFVGSLGGETKSTTTSWLDWLRNPGEVGIHAAILLSRNEVLRSSAEQLIQQISDSFEQLFPLVLLAVSDNPLPMIGEYLSPVEIDHIWPGYTLADCAEETYFSEEILRRWKRAIERKRQAIIYGPPGTGKTYIAEKLAKHLIAGGNGIIEVIQFHPAYAYEDFIQGIRPQLRGDGRLDYSLVPGRFLEFCQNAQSCQGCCVLILDEINRANLARVFGELMYLLEYRDQEVPLAGGGIFRIPGNIRIIGTMNTADRSIALVDHALRRRFAFLALYPEYEILRCYHKKTDFKVEGLIGVLQQLNNQIGEKHYAVGISFFLRDDLAEQLEDVWRMEIEPYIEEYFFDQQDKAKEFYWDRIKQKALS